MELVHGVPKIRVGTWNLEWANRAHVRPQQAEVIADAAADVWVLTEARANVLPHGWSSATSADIPSAVNERRSGDAGSFAVVGAPELEPVAVPELPTAACARVPINGQSWLVLGVCMPWRRGSPPLPDGATTGAQSGPAQWRTVLARVDAALGRLAPTVPSRHLLLVGDLNQTLSGSNVGFAGGRALLNSVLGRHRLVAYTAEQPSKLRGCRGVDHVCGPALPRLLESWPESADTLSDHHGYVVELG